MSTLRAGVIGLGVGARHLEHFASHPGCELAAVCDLYRDKTDAARERYPQVRVHATAEEIIDDPEVNVVSVASHDDHHHAQVLRALERGKHVFVEKPLCMTRPQLDEIFARLDARPGLRLSSNLNLRTSPLFLNLRREIQDGGMGRVVSLDADYLWGRSRMHRMTNGWRTAMDHYSIILGAAVHMVDLAIWLLDRRPATVQAWGNNIAMQGTSCPHDDFAALTLVFDDGCTAHVRAYGGVAHKHFHRVAVHGTDKCFQHGLDGPSMITYLDGPEPGTPDGRYPEYKDRGRCERTALDWEYPGVTAKGLTITSFLDAILRSDAPVVPEQDVFDAMAVCLAAEDSLRSGMPVRIDYPASLRPRTPQTNG